MPVFKPALWLLQCGLSLCLMLTVTNASALGLGSLKVRSSLNEPLNAEIRVISITKSERRTLKVRLASRQEFATAGVDRPFYLTKVKFTVAKRLNGTYFIQMRTHEPVREPFIHFLVHLEWAGGQLNREYSALIDPPYLARGKPGAIATPKIAPTMTRMDDTKSSAESTASASGQAQPKKIILAASKDSEPSVKTDTGVKTDTTGTKSSVEKLTDDSGSKGKSTETVTDVTVAGDTGTGDSGFDRSSGDGKKTAPAKFRTDDRGWPVHDDDTATTAKKSSKKSTADDAVGGTASTGSRYLGWAKMSEYRVRRGDMMWNVARRVRADTSLSLSQVTLAIYQYNRNAFFGNNVNNLKAGKILRLPDRDDILKLARKQARTKFFAQYDVWQQHKLRVAQGKQTIKIDQGKPVADKTPVKDKTKPVKADKAATPVTKVAKKATKKVAKKVTKKVTKSSKPVAKDKAASTVAKKPKADKKPVAKDKKPVKDATTKMTKKDAAQAKPKMAAVKKPVVVAQKKSLPKNLLQIVRNTLKRDKVTGKAVTADSVASAKKAKEKEKAALLAKADKTGENIDAVGVKTKEIGSKSGAVQKQIKKQEKLITIESSNLTKPGDKKAAVDVATKTDVKKPGDKKVDTKKPDDKKADTAAVAKKGPVKKPLIKKPPVKVLPTVSGKGMFETILDDLLANEFILYIAGGVLVLILLGVVMVVMRRRRSIAEFHESILNTGDATTDSGTLDSEGQAISAGDTSFLSDFSQGGMGNIHTDEVDPVAEAEVYLAYGRDEQAEEILKEAIVKSPERHELRVKLLEIYHQRNDVDAFETLAEELYAALEGRAGPPWDAVEEMGRKLNPENPMFRGGRPASMAEPKTDLNQPESDASSLFSDSTTDSTAMLDTQQTEALDTGGDAGGLDFDLTFDTPADDGSSVEKTAMDEAASLDENSGLDFESGLDMSPADTSPNLGDTFPDAEAAPGLGDTMPDTEPGMAAVDSEDSGINFDMGSGDSVEVGGDSGDVSLDLGDDETSISEGSDFSLDLGDDETSIAVDGGGDAEIEWDVDGDDSAGLDIDENDGIALETATATDVQTDDGNVQQWDETATKLDLAKAYIDMGDAEGARSILDEVMAEGNDAQKQQASDLAAQIS
jgi:pilus assembly protein FimV